MVNIQQLLRVKGNDIWSVPPVASLKEALILMAEKGIGALLILENGKVVGIFSERDYARQAASKDALSLTQPVSRLMTRQVYFVRPDQSIEECMALMSGQHIRHLPVMDGEKLVGIISIGDVVKQLISEKDITIRSLENYIMGREYIG